MGSIKTLSNTYQALETPSDQCLQCPTQCAGFAIVVCAGSAGVGHRVSGNGPWVLLFTDSRLEVVGGLQAFRL